VELIGFCVVASFCLIDWKSAITLVIFSVLFASLTFPLNGSALRKVALLTIGNILGLFWNIIFHYFSWVGFVSFGVAFNVFYTLVFPLLNLMWIVPFWSLSITFLPNLKT
jgi:hypothetical protein